METTFGQPQPLKGLSQFLVEHEQCGAGFDVSHPAGLGSGKVSMTCRGCGATYEYATATIEFEREVEFEPVTVRRAPDADVAPPPPPPAKEAAAPLAAGAAPALAATAVADAAPPAIDEGAPPKGPEKKPGKPEDEEANKKRRDRFIAAGLLVLATAAMAFAVYRVTHQSEEASEPPVETPPAATTKPPEAEAAPAKPKAKAEAPKPKAEPKQAVSQSPTPGPGEKQVKTAHFELIVPDSWTEQASDGGSLFAPAEGSPVSVQVFYENDPGMSKGTMATQTASFLRSRDSSATVGTPQDRTIEGDRAFELHAVGSAGTQVALGVLADPYRYLVIENADPDTSPALRNQADRAMSTFRPR